ncbi:MAG: hypothetical protein Q7T11_07900 [Deltaproteobacteria bacterium]|nr:hypothetical protein [Deltaproteobacteria bacterium]
MKKNIMRILGAAILIITGCGSDDNLKNQEDPEADPGLYDGALSQESEPKAEDKPDESPDSDGSKDIPKDDPKEDPRECDDCGPCGILGGCEPDAPIPDLPQCTITTVAGNGTPGTGYSYYQTDAANDGVSATGVPLYFSNFLGNIALDSSGTLHFSEMYQVRKITPTGTLERVAAIMDPYNIAFDAGNNLYAASCGSNRVFKISPDGTQSVFAGGGTDSLFCPTEVTSDQMGNIYINDRFGSLLKKITPDGVISTIPVPYGARSIVADSSGNLYISGGSIVSKISPEGISTIAGTPGVFDGPLGDGGPATSATVVATGMAFGPDGSLYIADARHHRIRKIDANGIITTIAGTGIPGFSGDDGPATAAQLNVPKDIAVDSDGLIYIVDRDNYRIRKMDCEANNTFSLIN